MSLRLYVDICGYFGACHPVSIFCRLLPLVQSNFYNYCCLWDFDILLLFFALLVIILLSL